MNEIIVPPKVKEAIAKKVARSDEAFALETQIKELRKGVAFSFLILGRLFKRYRDEKLYKLRDHTTFTSFISSVGFRRPTVYDNFIGTDPQVAKNMLIWAEKRKASSKKIAPLKVQG